MSRPRHPRPELEAVLRDAERKGWAIRKGRYYVMYCPCPEQHKKTVKITPRANYKRNLLGELNRATCWGRTEHS